MFAYTDPTGGGALEETGGLPIYRELVDVFYKRFHAVPKSGFTLLEAFAEAPSNQVQTTNVEWRAFPVTANATDAEIDGDRLSFQDEYVEWRVETSNGALKSVTFTTEFIEYYEALAAAGSAALKAEVQRLFPGGNPADSELFGSGFNPASATPRTRAQRFRANLERNPWNNGERGILCLTQQFNTMSALFNLLGACGVSRPGNAEDVCAKVGNACGPGRNSDPSVCTGAQNLARGDRSFSLQDPCGIRIRGLDKGGQWTVDGQPIDVNDESKNRGVWKVSRKGRRGVFTVQGDVRLGGAKVQTGAQLSQQLIVGAEVVHAPNAALPEWARTGQEGSRGPTV